MPHVVYGQKLTPEFIANLKAEAQLRREEERGAALREQQQRMADAREAAQKRLAARKAQ